MKLSGGAGENYYFTIGDDGSLTKGSDIGYQAKKSYIFNAAFNATLDVFQTRNTTVTLKKGTDEFSAIILSSDNPSKSVTLDLDNGNYSIETDQHIKWSLTNEIWNIYPSSVSSPYQMSATPR